MIRSSSCAETPAFSRALFGQKPSKTDEQEISLIKSFPIPNTKEDLYEFLILSQSNIDMEVYSSEHGQVNQNDVIKALIEIKQNNSINILSLLLY